MLLFCAQLSLLYKWFFLLQARRACHCKPHWEGYFNLHSSHAFHELMDDSRGALLRMDGT